MATVLFKPIKSTYVSNMEKCENYYTLNYLSLANYSKKCTLVKDDILLKFNLELLEAEDDDDDDITIRNAYLLLPLTQTYLNKCALFKGISLFAITEKICFEEVTWETMPKAKYITTSYLTREVIEQKYITFDITDLVYKLLKCGKECLELILSNQACDSIIISPKNSILDSPAVVVDYVNDEEENKCCCGTDTTAIELQLNDLSGGLIGPCEPIIFNDIVVQTSNGISYNAYNGEIIITKKGFYSFNLSINVEGINDVCPINITLKNLTKSTYTDFHMPSQTQGQLVGTALINVTEPLEKFVLINNSTSTIQLSDIDVQSTLIISSV